MSDPNKTKGKRRFLIEVRGVLEVEVDSGTQAQTIAEAWITAVGSGTLPSEPVRVRWLRIEPESDEHPGWPPPSPSAKV